MLIHDDNPSSPAATGGERALATAIDMVWEGREEVGRYLAVVRSRSALRDARARCLDEFGARTANRGVLLRALALIDDALDRLDGTPDSRDHRPVA
jgi:hypothetical protein